jgi:carbamoyltransferase
MYILGITHPVSRNAAACLLKDGKIIAFAEEERFNRIKHSSYLPADRSIKFCLSYAGIDLSDVDYIAVGYSKFLNIVTSNIVEKALGAFERVGISKAISGEKQLGVVPLIKKYILDYHEGIYRMPVSLDDPRVTFVRHHQTHLASAFYVSPFKEACII